MSPGPGATFGMAVNPANRLPQDTDFIERGDDIGLSVDGSWEDMEAAQRRGLIDAKMYRIVLQNCRYGRSE